MAFFVLFLGVFFVLLAAISGLSCLLFIFFFCLGGGGVFEGIVGSSDLAPGLGASGCKGLIRCFGFRGLLAQVPEVWGRRKSRTHEVMIPCVQFVILYCILTMVFRYRIDSMYYMVCVYSTYHVTPCHSMLHSGTLCFTRTHTHMHACMHACIRT